MRNSKQETVAATGPDDLETSVWRFLHALFRAPSADQWARLRGAEMRDAWAALCALVAIDLDPVLPAPVSARVYEEEYVSRFDVGVPHPPVPLMESHWNRRESVSQVLREHILFFRQFGLTVRQPSSDGVDHLRRQLAFMAFLSAEAAGDSEGAEACRRARADFRARRMRSWIPAAARKCESLDPESWSTQWLRLLDRCCEMEIAAPC